MSDLNVMSVPRVAWVLSKFKFGNLEQSTKSAILGSFSMNIECRIKCDFCRHLLDLIQVVDVYTLLYVPLAIVKQCFLALILA